MFSLLLPLVVVLAIVAALVGRQQGRHSGAATWQPRRIVSYTLAFAGLMAVLYAAAGMLALAVTTVTLRSDLLVSQNDLRSRASFYLAALIVGMPILLAAWLPRRRIDPASPERNAGERRLFLAAIFATSAVVALFALQRLLGVVLTIPGPAALRPSVLDGIAGGAQLLVWGAAWVWFARLGWRERGPREEDEWHDLGVYVLCGFALGCFTYGLYSAVQEIVSDLLSAGPPLLNAPAGAAWSTWGSIAAWLLTGGAVWLAAWRYDLIRGGRRRLRVIYLYIVLAIAVPTALYGAGNGLYELLRQLFGANPTDSVGVWRDTLPLLLVFGAVWIHHWQVVRRQAALAGASALHGAIVWPRRPAIALLTLLGLAVTAPAVISLLWLGLDAALRTGIALSGAAWWRDRASLGLAGTVVGAAVWLSDWARLQWAVAAEPASERPARSRQLLLQTIVLISALCALGFTIAALWQLLQMLLGMAPDASTISTTLKYLSAAIVSAALLAYYSLILRQDMRLRPATARRVRVVALVAAGAETTLAGLRADGQPIEVLGRLTAGEPANALDAAALGAQLTALGAQENVDGALLILRADGGHLYPYSTALARQAQASTEPMRPPELTAHEAAPGAI